MTIFHFTRNTAADEFKQVEMFQKEPYALMQVEGHEVNHTYSLTEKK